MTFKQKMMKLLAPYVGTKVNKEKIVGEIQKQIENGSSKKEERYKLINWGPDDTLTNECLVHSSDNAIAVDLSYSFYGNCKFNKVPIAANDTFTLVLNNYNRDQIGFSRGNEIPLLVYVKNGTYSRRISFGSIYRGFSMEQAHNYIEFDNHIINFNITSSQKKTHGFGANEIYYNLYQCVVTSVSKGLESFE